MRQTRYLHRSKVRALTGFLVCLIIAVWATSIAVAAHPTALSARSLSATDTAHLHYLPRESEGETLVEEGTAAGDLPGRMRVHLKIGASVSGTFIFYPRGGTITGVGTATVGGSGTYESFHGTLVVRGGTGRFAHARGRAGLYGVFDRNTYRLTVQTTGRLSY